MGSGSEIVGMMYGAYDQFFFHSNCEDGIAFLEFFISMIVGVSIGEDQSFSHAVTVAEDDHSAFSVYARVVALQPVMPEVNVFLAKVHYCEVDPLAMFSNCH